uniref:Uncharacterized protein n=1 Tax=Panagrolaimus davidi TaxID=227884 RepID=A0A914QSZ2_9BILA
MEAMDVSLAITNHRKTPVFVYESSKRQYFAFPKFMMDYIRKNPNSWKLWKKLIQSCKWFFDKNPIVVISCLHYCRINGFSTCLTAQCTAVHDRRIKFTIAPFKLWITGLLEIVSTKSGAAAKCSNRVYKCESMFLMFQLLTVDEFEFLTHDLSHLELFGTRILDKSKKLVSFENILERLPQLESITYNFMEDGRDVTPDTVKKIAKMEYGSKLHRIYLPDIPPTFDFDAFSNFMLENKQISFELEFHDRSTTEEYMIKVKAFAEKLKTENCDNHRRPEIFYNYNDLVNDTNGDENDIINDL